MTNYINELNISQIKRQTNEEEEGSSFYGSEEEVSSWCNES